METTELLNPYPWFLSEQQVQSKVTANSEALQSENSCVSVWEQLQYSLRPLEALPKIITNIETSRQTRRDGSEYVVLRNPAVNTYIRIDMDDYALLPLMDGTRTVNELVFAFFQIHGILSPTRIIHLVSLLQTKYFLSDSPQDVYAEIAAQMKRPSAGVLAVKILKGFVHTEIPLKHVDEKLDHLYRWIGWLFFTRPGLWIGATLAVLGPVLYMLQLGRARYPLLNPGGSYLAGLVLLMALMVFSLLAHEMGHAMAVKHAGRHVKHGGLLIYYGFLGGYVETTDIWMAPRRQRLAVSFAGPYMDLVSAGACAVASLLLPSGGLREALYTWGFILLTGTVFNFNPLLELDGYYILVDLLEKPLLRARALAFARSGLWEKLRSHQTLKREEIFYALFGLASAAYSVVAVFLAGMFWELRVSRLLAEELASGNPFIRISIMALVALISIPLLIAFKNMAGRLSRRISAGFESVQAAVTVWRQPQPLLRPDETGK